MYFIVELLYTNLVTKMTTVFICFYIFFKSRRKMLLIMENHIQKMLLNRNATSQGALLKKCLKACRTSWKCKKDVSARGRGKPEPEVVEGPRPLPVLWRL